MIIQHTRVREILLSPSLAGNDGLHFCLHGGWKEAMEEEGRGAVPP